MNNNAMEFAPPTTPFKEQWLPLDRAIQRVVKFEHEFGKAHFLFACHAALPSILTPELINLIRINFLEESVEWIAESDVLLSSLCIPINQGVFEVEPQVRQVLLIALQNDPDYGPERLDDVAYFLHAYNTSPLANKLPVHIRQTYQWISDAYLSPDATIQSMFDLLNKPAKENLTPRVTDYLQVGKTLALIANPLEMTSLQVELEDLADSTHYSALYWYGDTENLLTSLQMNASSLDDVTQTLTSSIVHWLETVESTTTDDLVSRVDPHNSVTFPVSETPSELPIIENMPLSKVRMGQNIERTDYWRRKQGQRKVIAFIHGIGAKDPFIYWQKFLSVLEHDETFRDFDLFIWQYPTHMRPDGVRNLISILQRKTLRETAPSIEKIGSAWKSTYDSQFQGYQDIILVCHSMGGLIVKSWILDTLEHGESTKLAALRYIAFYATPHQGGPITTLGQWNQQLKDMQLDSPFIEHMGRRWHDHIVAWKDQSPGAADERSNRYIPHLVLAGLQDKVVPPEYATIRGMPLILIQGDHSGVIHPTNSNDTRYKTWSIDLAKTFNIIPPAHIVSAIADQRISHALSEGKDKKESQPVIPEQGKQSPNTITPPSTDTTQRSASPTPASPNAVTVFISYAPEDEVLLRQLETHLSTLWRNGVITLWSKRLIVPGTDWAQKIDQRIEQASIILFLVSSDFLASDYHNQVEVKRALERQKAGQAHVIPIIVRPVDWEDTTFGHLRPLPRDGKPITIWHHRDEAFLNVVEGIKNVLEPRSSVRAAAQPAVAAARKSGSFPPIWNVPYRYPAFFTGRDQMVEQLFERFTPQFLSGPIPAWAMTGLGGLGKTQTAVAYAYRHREKYQSVLWANAETEGDLATSFTQMAQLLALPGIDLQQRESVLDGMQEWFTRTTDWLLIIDNADDLVMVRKFLPTFASGHVLLTSRVVATGDGGAAQALELPPLSPDDGALCLLRRANYIPWTGQLRDAPSQASVKAAKELCQLMGGLPLALEQAGAYIEITGRGIEGYLELYKKYRHETQQRYYGDVRSYREAVAFTWTIARESVQSENPAALELLYLCAFLAPNAIPYTLFPKGARILGPILGPVAAHPLRLDQTIMLLWRYSLIQRQTDRDTDISQFSIHRVLQEILRDGMDQATQRLWAKRVVRVVALALDEVEWSIMQAHVQRCLPLIEQWQMNFHEADMIRQLFRE